MTATSRQMTCRRSLDRPARETLTLRAFGVKLTVNRLTGMESSSVDVELNGMATKSPDRVAVRGVVTLRAPRAG
jgi:hypothetical protein